MIKRILLFAGLLFISISGVNAQTEKTVSPTPIKRTQNTEFPVAEEPKPQISVKSSTKTTTISKRAGEEQQVHDEQYYKKQLIQIDGHISAIDEKVIIVNNNIEEKKIAEENGWFESMAKTRSDLVQRKQDIQDKLNNFSK